MVFFAIGSSCEAIAGAAGWNELLYRTWYFSGAICTAGWLGLGTAFLLGRTRFGYTYAVLLLMAGVFTLLTQRKYDYPGSGSAPVLYLVAGIVLAIAVGVETYFQNRRLAADRGGRRRRCHGRWPWCSCSRRPCRRPATASTRLTSIPTGEILPGSIRLLTPFLNITGGLRPRPRAPCTRPTCSCPSAASSTTRSTRTSRATSSCSTCSSRRSRSSSTSSRRCPGAVNALVHGRLHSRVPATILIAIGAFVASSTDTLNRFGSTELFQAGKLVAVILILAGFLVSIEAFREIRIPFTAVRLAGVRTEHGRLSPEMTAAGTPAR